MLLQLFTLLVTGIVGAVGGFFSAETLQQPVETTHTPAAPETVSTEIRVADPPVVEEAMRTPSLVHRGTVESASLRNAQAKEEPLNTYSAVSVEGIVAFTNQERAARRVGKLTVDPQLMKMAEKKVDDMFARQYFAHESPNGDNVEELADSVGYRYLFVGENLALGKFRTSAEIVAAWMKSPGHRENLLKTQYEQIGVAARTGIYEGKTVWIAVQEFGLPVSVCNAPDASLKVQINQNVLALATLRDQITELRTRLEGMPSGDPEYASVNARYNELVDEYNGNVDQYKADVAEYNRTVEEYNECIEKKAD